MTPTELEAALLGAFADARITITDLTGTEDHYKARIVSAAFVGKTRLQQHREVYAALGDAMKGPVHALALETYTPDDWAKTQA